MTDENFDFDSYNLSFVQGIMGKGKTAYLVAKAVENYQNYNKIYANFKIDLPNFIFVPNITGPIIKGFEPHSALFFQEAYTKLDCRYCAGKERKEILEAIFHIRKDNISIYADIIKLLFLDFRIIDVATEFWSAMGRENRRFIGYENVFSYQKMVPFHIGKNEYMFRRGVNKIVCDMSKYYKYYNTREKTGSIQKIL